MSTVLRSEFKAQIATYLATLKPGYPKTLAEIIALSEKVTAPTPEGYMPNPIRLNSYRQSESGPPLTDPMYLAAKNFGLPFVREVVLAIFASNRLDAIVYPTSPKRPARISEAPTPGAPPSFRRRTMPTSRVFPT